MQELKTERLSLPEDSKILIKFSSNWADEMDIEAFEVVTVKSWNKWLNHWQSLDSFGLSVGTNEEIEWDCLEDYLSDLTLISITEEEAKFLEKVFSNRFGHYFLLEDNRY